MHLSSDLPPTYVAPPNCLTVAPQSFNAVLVTPNSLGLTPQSFHGVSPQATSISNFLRRVPILKHPSRVIKTPSCRPRSPAVALARDELPLPSPSNTSAVHGDPPSPSQNIVQAALSFANVLWRFARPHTVYGSVASVISMSFIGACSTATPVPFASLVLAIVAAVLMNVYIVGLNQLCDIEIDRINKPNLPLASGDLTVRTGQRVIVGALVSSIALGYSSLASNPLRVVLLGSALLGTLYSMPPFRLKRYALLASVCILSVRGLLVNSCFFLHAAGETALWPLKLTPFVSFVCMLFVVFGIIIALLKDVPDIRGDRVFNIRTFSVRVGAEGAFRLIQILLLLMYILGSVWTFRLASSVVFKWLGTAAHVLVGFEVLRRSGKVNIQDPKSITKFYMDVWKAFYFEYLILPLSIL